MDARTLTAPSRKCQVTAPEVSGPVLSIRPPPLDIGAQHGVDARMRILLPAGEPVGDLRIETKTDELAVSGGIEWHGLPPEARAEAFARHGLLQRVVRHFADLRTGPLHGRLLRHPDPPSMLRQSGGAGRVASRSTPCRNHRHGPAHRCA